MLRISEFGAKRFQFTLARFKPVRDRSLFSYDYGSKRSDEESRHRYVGPGGGRGLKMKKRADPQRTRQPHRHQPPPHDVPRKHDLKVGLGKGAFQITPE